MSWVAERIEHWPLARLLPYARNARTQLGQMLLGSRRQRPGVVFLHPFGQVGDGAQGSLEIV